MLRIHLILKRIRTRKRWIRIQVISLKFTVFYQQSIIFKFFVSFNRSDLGFEIKKFCLQFLVIFYPLHSDPWLRIFLRIRIQEAKILRIQLIRIGVPLAGLCFFSAAYNLNIYASSQQGVTFTSRLKGAVIV